MDTMQQFVGGGGMVRKTEARKAKFIRKIMEGNELTRRTSLQKRLPTLKTKAYQLQTLSGVSVCVASSGVDGRVKFLWPEDPKQAREAIEAYRRADKEKKGEMTVLGCLERRKRDGEKNRRRARIRSLADPLSDWIDGISSEKDALANAAGLLGSKIAELEEKLRLQGKEQKGETESGDESSDDDDGSEGESNEEEIERRISSEQASPPSATHQPVAVSWNDNGGLADPVQSHPQPIGGGDGGEHCNSIPVWQSGGRFADGGKSMMHDDTLPPPLFTDSLGIQFQNCSGRVFGMYPNVSPLHEALPFNVWAPQYY
ncbi:unnamed protein product [Linum trigynum]|uniref:MADS-box domain-containing protein n=1 Tax=Linum trigynum TaxID=586398 RepID=A0AAV2ENJ8_9ROSI